MIHGKINWLIKPSVKQNFSLPPVIIYYFSQNPSTPEIYCKLIQSCKSFFEKFPLLVATKMFCKTKFCRNDAQKFSFEHEKKCYTDVDLDKLKTNIWITDTIYLTKNNISAFASLIYPKLYRWTEVFLSIISEVITYSNFKSCAIFLRNISFYNVQIINDDGSIVVIDSLLEICPNIEIFEYYIKDNASMIAVSTMKNICKLKHLQHLKRFILWNLPEVFDVEDISAFMKDHCDTKIWLSFDSEISEEYKIQLNTLIDNVIECEIYNHLIKYPGQNEEKYKIMDDRLYRR